MRLPLLVSVPHAGHEVPSEAAPYCVLSEEDIHADGDGGARAIYDIADEVEAFVSTDVARAIVDMNRPPDDFRGDGVVKTHTCWDVPVYDPPLPPGVARVLIRSHHRPYHERLSRLAVGVVAGIDCHTMAATAPPEAPDPGARRPAICLSDAHGTLPRPWFDALSDALRASFGVAPSHNAPFRGGYIIRQHSRELPWVQLELSRDAWLDDGEKRRRVLTALHDWVGRIRSRADVPVSGHAAPGSAPGP